MKKYQGLKPAEVQKRLQQFGFNELDTSHKVPLWQKFLRQFKDLMVLILIGAAFVSIVVALIENTTEELIDAYVILGIVVLNAFIGFIQEYRTEKALEALQQLMSPRARVMRAGKDMMIDARLVVPGDMLILAEGDKVAADAVLIEAYEAKVEESALTGESVPVSKEKVNNDIEKIFRGGYLKEDELEAIDRDEKIYTGTSLVSGSAVALVVNTGMRTEFGKIAELTATTVKDLSPLQKELYNIGIFVGKITFFISSILFLTGILIQGQTFIESMLFSVSVAVAAVPEGLPATITIALAMGVQRLARRNAIVKQLSSVETLGSTTVICSDKTGTLTKNQMTAKKAYLASGIDLLFSGAGYEPKGRVDVAEHLNGVQTELSKFKDSAKGDIEKMMQVISLCNDATLIKERGKWKILGDPTEGALITAAQKCKTNIKNIDRLQDFPFDSDRKRMSVIVDPKSGKKYELFVKGAPDSILKLSNRILKDGKVRKISKEDKKFIVAENNAMADDALRVLAVAYREVDSKKKLENIEKEDVEKDLIFIGLIGMIDPPRVEVKKAMDMCHEAGIRAIVITGDYGKTAVAIAKELDIVTSKDCRVVTGDELKKMKEDQLRKILKKEEEIIFARVAPDHKMRVVNALKKLGEIVAVTGDGVNDAPALKRADIGVAMGITGTDVAKEASNMVLTDDSFASIVKAIKEGRIIYKNLRKFVWYIFSCNVGELVTVFTAIILQIPAPLTAILILCVDLGTDVLPALALGIDPAEPGIMQEKPRNPKARIMNKKFIFHFLYLGLVIGGLVVGVYLYDLMQHGWNWGDSLGARSYVHLHASTMAFATLVLIQMVNAFNARSERLSNLKLSVNYHLWGAISVSILLTIAMVHVPAIQSKIHTVDLSLNEWGLVLLTSSAIFFIEETRKAFLRVGEKVVKKTK